jgi:DNA-binding MarR family transcriptional regulator
MPRLNTFEKTAWYLIGATRGGPTRIKIINEIIETPKNTNQISTSLKVDYKTAQHHLEKLLKMNWVTKSMDKYGELYFVTFTDEEKEILKKIIKKIEKKK